MNLLKELMDISEKSETKKTACDNILEAKRVFARTIQNKVVRKIRCTAGRRKGRVVKSAADCFKKKNIKKSRKAKLSSRKTRFVRTRKSRLTRRKAASKMVRRLNQRNRG